MNKMASVSLGDRGDGAGASEGVEDGVAPVAVEFNQSLDQLFRKWSRMTSFLFPGVLRPLRGG